MVDPLVENPMIATFFSADPGGPGLTLEQLKSRRAIAAALAAKSRDYPNTIGKGIFSLGESIGDIMRDSKLDAAEKRMRAGDLEKLKASPPGSGPAMEPPPPIGAPGPAAGAPPGSTAALDPEVDLSRAQIADALTGGAQGSRGAGPGATQMAALPTMDTISDAGQPGLTYGGPSPAGPGASMAERPDQAPPTPSAPPVGMAGPGPAGTPAPGPVAGGGAPPGLPPGVDAARAGLAQQIAGANQAFNPDAAGPGGLGGGVPPQMLAQVGGFGPGSALGPPVSAAAPQQNRPGPQYGAGGRPVPPPEFVPPTEADRAKLFGPQAKPPEAWPEAEKKAYQQAIRDSLDPYRSDEFKALKRAHAEDIVKRNQTRYTTAHEDYRAKQTQERSQLDKLYEEMKKKNEQANDPEYTGKKELAESDLRIMRKTGMPAGDVHKQMRSEQEAAKKAMKTQEDNQLILQALHDGVITGTLADYRKQGAKLAGWAFGSEYMKRNAINSETMIARLNSRIGEVVKELRPVSEFEVKLGQASSGADLGLEKQTIDSLVRQNIEQNNKKIAEYDTKADRIYSGERQAKEFESPSLDWIPKPHVEALARNVANPATRDRHIGLFNSTYGPGSAETVLNRVRLRGGI